VCGSSAVLSRTQLQAFEEDGFVRLEQGFAVEEAERMCARVWDFLEARDGVRRDDPTTWYEENPRGFQSLTRAGAFDGVATDEVVAALDHLLRGEDWMPRTRWGQPLVTMPRPGSHWTIPNAGWHIDWPPRGTPTPLFGARVLAFLDDVFPRAGGTVVLAGSHRLVARSVASGAAARRSADLRRRLAREHPWLASLFSGEASPGRADRLLRQVAEVDGSSVCVTELAGHRGEVALLHPWLFHAAAPNTSNRARMMVSHSVNTARGLALYSAEPS